MNEENENLGKIYHEQIKLSLFPVYYDVFFCDTMWISPMAVSNRYPWITLDVDPTATSMNILATSPGKPTGVIVLFAGDDEKEINNAIVFEAVNLSWLILSELEIKIDADNYKIQSYIVEEIHKKLTEAFERYLGVDLNDIEDSDENFDGL